MSWRRPRSGATGRGRGRRAASGPTLWTPASIATADQVFWYRDEVTLSGSDVATWVDKSASGLGAATPPGNAPAWVASDGDFGTAVDFDQSNSEYLEVPGTLTEQRFFHDGTGIVIGFAFKGSVDGDASMSLLANMVPNASNTGLSIRQDTSGGDNHIALNLGNGSGTYVVAVTTASGSAPFDSIHTAVIALADNAAGDDYHIYLDGVLAVNGTFVGSPDTVNDSSRSMKIGVLGNPSLWHWGGTMGEVVASKSFDDAADLAEYLHREHGT